MTKNIAEEILTLKNPDTNEDCLRIILILLFRDNPSIASPQPTNELWKKGSDFVRKEMKDCPGKIEVKKGLWRHKWEREGT